MQKLHALAAKYYQGVIWSPQKGDYYTSSRADLELYQIIEIQNNIITTIYCDKQCSPQAWGQNEFTTTGFGPNRVHVPLWILEHIDTNNFEKTSNQSFILIEIIPQKIMETLSSEECLLDSNISDSIYAIRALKVAVDLHGKTIQVKKDHVRNNQVFIESHKIWLQPHTWKLIS